MPPGIRVIKPGIDPTTKSELAELLRKRVEECQYGDILRIKTLLQGIGSLKTDSDWNKFLNDVNECASKIVHEVNIASGRNRTAFITWTTPIAPAGKQFVDMRTLIRKRPELQVTQPEHE
jgi:hypothetical protein